MAFVAAEPDVEGAALEIVDVPIERRHGFLSARLPTGALVEGTTRHMLAALHGLMHWDLSQSHPTSPVLHGATVLIEGRRLVLMADKGAGKTTLTLSLLAAGHGIEGDEHLVLEPDAVIARPRTLRVKTASLRLVGDGPATLAQCPRIDLWGGGHIYAVNPSLFGRPWIIRRGQLDGLVFIEANHGGRSVAKPMARDEAFRRLMRTAMFPGTSLLAETARVRRLVSAVPAFSLRLGDLTGAQFHLKHLAQA